MTDVAADNPVSPDGGAPKPATLAHAETGRSLFGDAWLRLKANKAAMVSLYYLVAMTIACVVGPYFSPHNYSTIYADYVRVPPSLSPYPDAASIETSLNDVIKRMRLDLKEWRQEGERVYVTVTSSKEIDDRNTRYIDRSDTFEDARVESKSADGTEAVFSAAV